MRRRDLFAFVGGTTAWWPLLARAQREKMPVIGFLSGGSPSFDEPNISELRKALSEMGYIESKNLRIEYRWAQGRYDQLRVNAAELIARKVDVIVAIGPAAASAARTLTPTIPVVFTMGDPVEGGFVASLAHPGGNLTGVSVQITELMPKRLELLAELVPQATRIALLIGGNMKKTEDLMQDAARAKHIELPIVRARNKDEIDTAFASLAELKPDGVVIGDNPFFNGRRGQIIELGARYALPMISAWRDFAVSGGLMSYGASGPSSYRQVGVYAGKILNGAAPADLPVEQPTKFDLVINLKTANALGLTIPPVILNRADEVIE